MLFEDRLKAVAHDVDHLLNTLLPPSDQGEILRIAQAMRYASLGQGKRLRPFFVLESAGLFGHPEGTGALRVAVSLECVHCYSLVHDDLPAMDNDDLRRGRPTCHKAFDEATAILAGDGLLTLAFGILSDPQTHDDPAVRCTLLSHLAKASGHLGMVGGQMRDLEAETKNNLSLKDVLTIQSLKTGALFEYALESGAILGRAGEWERLSLVTYAQKIGLAFQITDDLLDVLSSQEILGKATQKDKAAGKATFIDFLGVDGAKIKAKTLVDEALECLTPFGSRADLLKEAARFLVARSF